MGHAWSWGDRGWAPPPPPPLPNPNILHLQVLGASEQPSQFSLTNAAGTHTTSEGVSSPTPGELLFSSFHNLLSEPYFWSLPTSFRGDKVGRAEGQPRQGGHWENRDSVARLKSPAESLSTPVPGDFLRRRAALHRDPAAPAQFCTPAQTATGGVAGQQHCVGTSCLKGAQPWPAQQLHSALPRGEPHPVPSGSSLWGASAPRVSGMDLMSLPLQQAWQRPDGQPATREHLLMALAGIDALLIQASYTQQPAESR